MSSTSPESAHQPSHPDQTRLALAALAACFAVSLDESSESFLTRFEVALKDLNHHIGDTSTIDNSGALETLRWTNEFVRELRAR